LTNDLKTLVREKGIEYFLCSFVEMSGIPKAKLVPATALDDMVTDGAGFAGFAAGDVGQGPHDPDLVSIPDMNAMIVLPWKKNIAWVPGMLQVENQPSQYCPRRILAHQLEIGRQRGLSLVYRNSRRFEQLLAQTGARHIRTPPYTPRWNGKVERFIQTLQNEWAYSHTWPNSHARARTLLPLIRNVLRIAGVCCREAADYWHLAHCASHR